MGGHVHSSRTRHAVGISERHPRLNGGRTPMVAGQIRVVPVYTPAHMRGRGYAGAATVEVSRAALSASAVEVLLSADLANPTNNGLY